MRLELTSQQSQSLLLPNSKRPTGWRAPQWRRGHFSAPGNHGVGIAVGNHSGGEADIVGAGGTGGGNGYIGALQAKFNRQIAGYHIDNGTGDKKRRYSPWSFAFQQAVIGLDKAQSADARANGGTDAVSVVGGYL